MQIHTQDTRPTHPFILHTNNTDNILTLKKMF